MYRRRLRFAFSPLLLQSVRKLIFHGNSQNAHVTDYARPSSTLPPHSSIGKAAMLEKSQTKKPK
jgi:hypothetical protein